MTSNDNNAAIGVATPPSDAHGRAALLLVESLIHGLYERSALSIGEAVEIAERAIDVQAELAEAADDAPMWESHALLSSIAASLRADEHETST